MVIRTVRLTSDHHYGKRLPRHSGRMIDAVLDLAPRAVAMAFRRRSGGNRPNWLKAATDFRFIGHDGDDATDLHFEAPIFGEAAPGEYEQGEFWPTKPAPEDTGFEILADVVRDLMSGNRDSDRFDRPLLKHVIELHQPFHQMFRSMEIGGQRAPLGSAPKLSAASVATARTFYDTTPGSRRVKVFGKLDMVRASTQRFAFILPSGEEAQGILREGDICDFQGLLSKPIVVFGRAVYRPSGRLLRVDADKIGAGSDADQFFGTIPHGIPAQPIVGKTPATAGKGGVNAIFGKWPGAESDEQVAEALRRLS
jgi:hypothetical protein